MSEPLDGWYPNLDPAIYYASTAIGSGDLKRAARSLAHMRRASRKDTPALAFGRAYHCAVLEPADFQSRYLVAPDIDRRSNAGKMAWAQWQREAAGREVISQESMDAITAMAAAAREHAAVRWLSSDHLAERELSGFWIDPTTGVRCRMRLDHMRSDNIVSDLKTAKDASPEEFGKAIVRYGYHVQEAHYRAGCEALGRPVRAWVFVAQESEEPYAVATYSIPPECLQLGVDERNRTLAKIAEAQAADRWPAYGEDILTPIIPPWAYRASAPTA